MISAGLGSAGFGFPSLSSIAKTALNPIAATKASISATKTVANKAAPVAKVALNPIAATKMSAKVIYKAHEIPTKWLALKPTEWLADKALAPVKSRVQKLVNRRAAQIAMDKRHVATPTPSEREEARAWVRHKLTYDGPAGTPTPHGKILAYFAGAPIVAGQFGVAPAVAAAAVPVLVALATAMINKYAKSGEAPETPRASGGGGSAPAPQEPMAPGTVDMTPVQNAVDDMAAQMPPESAEAVDAAAQAAGLKKPSRFKLTKNHMIIGGAVIGGLVLLSVLTKKS